MRHTYECPLRWADMDMLGHVNNVTYMDYLQEARIELFASHRSFQAGEAIAEGVVVVRHEVEFVTPLTFRRQPVLIDTWVSWIKAGSFAFEYEVYDDSDAGRVVFLRATTVMAPFVFDTGRPRRITAEERVFLEGYLETREPRPELSTAGKPRHSYPLRVRWSDVDAYRHVNNVQYFEFFQEARISYVMDLHTRGEQWSEHVVARTDIDYLKQMQFQHQPYDVRSWVSHVGTRSFTIAGEICDENTVFARCQVVMVTFDRETQQAAAMPEDQRAALLAQLR